MALVLLLVLLCPVALQALGLWVELVELEGKEGDPPDTCGKETVRENALVALVAGGGWLLVGSGSVVCLL